MAGFTWKERKHTGFQEWMTRAETATPRTTRLPMNCSLGAEQEEAGIGVATWVTQMVGTDIQGGISILKMFLGENYCVVINAT